MESVVREIGLLLKSRYGLIRLETRDAGRVIQALRQGAQQEALRLFVWQSEKKGFVDQNEGTSMPGTADLSTAVDWVGKSVIAGLFVFVVPGSVPSDPHFWAKLEEAGRHLETRRGGILLCSPTVELPLHLAHRVPSVQLPPLTDPDYRGLLVELIKAISQDRPVRVELNQGEGEQLIRQLRGLTLEEAEKRLRVCLMDDHALTRSDLETLKLERARAVEESGLLELWNPPETPVSWVGLKSLRDWLEQRKRLFSTPEQMKAFSLPYPKGILLTGIPGTGKSLTAKWVAQSWSLPLFRLELAALYNKYVGESERRLREALAFAEYAAPAVLWVDEIEKAFGNAGDGGDHGLTQRLLGTFLSWLQEREGEVFLVATCNDVTRIPPEFTRKGRIDEVFFFDLPEMEARHALWKVALSKRNLQHDAYPVAELVQESEGFTGADIEQCVIAMLYTSLSAGESPSFEKLLAEVRGTHPLAVARPEEISALREWSRGKARPAT